MYASYVDENNWGVVRVLDSSTGRTSRVYLNKLPTKLSEKLIDGFADEVVAFHKSGDCYLNKASLTNFVTAIKNKL